MANYVSGQNQRLSGIAVKDETARIGFNRRQAQYFSTMKPFLCLLMPFTV